MKKIIILSIFFTFISCKLFGQTDSTKNKTDSINALNIKDTSKSITTEKESEIKAKEVSDVSSSDTKKDTVKRTSNRELLEKFNSTKKNIQETNNFKLVKKLETISDNENPNRELNSIKKEFEKKQKELNVDINTIEIKKKLAKKQKIEDVELENDLDSAAKNNPIDPTHFINIYQTIPKVGKARLIKNKKLQPYSVVNINSKITIDFDIDAIAKDNKFYGSLTLVGKLNSREIEVSPYSLVGKDYTPIGTTSGFSTKDFASSLVGLLAAADENKSVTPRTEKNRKTLNELKKQNIAIKNRQKYLNIINNNDVKKINYDDWEDKNFRDYVLSELQKNLAAFQSFNYKLIKSDSIVGLNNKIDIDLSIKIDSFDNTNNNIDSIKKSYQILIDSLIDLENKLSDSLPEYIKKFNKINDKIYDLGNDRYHEINKIYALQRKILKREDELIDKKNMLTILTTLNADSVTIFSDPLKDGKITKELFKYYYNQYYNNPKKYPDYGESYYRKHLNFQPNSINKPSYYDNSNLKSETTDNLKEFINNNKTDFDKFRIFGSYVEYLEKSEKESKALSLSLNKSPVLIAEIINNLKISINEMSGSLKIIDSIYNYNNDKNSIIGVAIPVIENYIYNSEKLNTAIYDLNKINTGYVIGEINNKNWLNNNTVPLSDKATLTPTYPSNSSRSRFTNSKYYDDKDEDEVGDKENEEDNYKSLENISLKNENSNNSVEKQILYQGKKIKLYDLINQNINGFGEYLIDKIATETGLNLYRTLKSGEIYLEKESPKEGDILQIELIWNRYDNQSNLKPVRIPVATFKTKTTGWNSKVMESFFLVYNINPDKNNPDLVRSVFTGAAGVSLLFGYSGDNSSYFGYKQSTRFENRYTPKGNGQGLFKSIANALEPSFGVNVSYLNFDNKESVEIGTGLLVGLFNNSILGTLGYNLNIAPGWNGFYWGLGFSFVDIAKKIKGANP